VSVNTVGLFTLTRREIVRSLKIINQVIWPPIITTLLYVFIFGFSLGSRIPQMQGVSYSEFLIPGLIVLQVVDASYGESSSSLFQARFMQAIQELLIAPMSALEIAGGYILGSLARSLLIAVLITALGFALVRTLPSDWGLYLLVICMISVLFSSLGLIFGLLAEKFDHIAVLTTFVITPLTFVGGVFTSATLLPPFLQKAQLFNPLFYCIDAFRYSYTGQSFLPLGYSLAAICVMAVFAFGIALRMMSVGYKLRA
jgi:ABC-2 type transport system permease protein